MSLFRVWYFGVLLNAVIVIVNCLIPPTTIHRGLWRPSARLIALSAKKKESLLISNELLASITAEEDRFSSLSAADTYGKTNSKGTSTSKQNKKSEGKKKLFSDSLLQSILIDDDEQNVGPAVESIQQEQFEGQPHAGIKQKQENEEPAGTVFESKVETKSRKGKPSTRMRFTTTSQPNYVSIGLERASVTIGNEVILKDASLLISTGERVGLVGPNGGGKSTLLRILAGELAPTTGTILKSSADLRIAYLKQEFAEGIVPERTLRDELLSVFADELQTLSGIQACESELAAGPVDPDKLDALLAQLEKLQEHAFASRCYDLEARVQRVMDNMGFAPEDGMALVGSFSGGWKMRIGLAKMLLLDPHVLLLDEPTNHMDLDSVIWLEGFLQRQSLPMLVVSHDREFLDQISTKIVDIEEGSTVTYSGNYSRYLTQRRDRLAQWRERYEKQQRHIKEEEQYIKKAHGDASLLHVAKSKESALRKLKASAEYVLCPPKDRKFRFRFPTPPRCGENILEASGISHGYGEGRYKVLFEDVDVQVDRGDRIGFIGPNGSGKSTLMRILTQEEDPRRGFCDYGSKSIVTNYYAQNQADALDLEASVLEIVQRECPLEMSPTDLRTLLGQFMFKGDDVYKKVGVLSGGEKARVALCRMMLRPANLLLLDEPTNHLDITAKEVLEEALQHYAGAVLLISHDRYFLSQVANTIFSFQDRRVERHDCDYHDFLLKQAEALQQQQQQEHDDTLRDTEQASTHHSSAVQSLKEKVTSRYVSGDKYRVTNAKEVLVDPAQQSGRGKNKKRSYGGSGVTCGNPYKGIKNAKRFKDSV